MSINIGVDRSHDEEMLVEADIINLSDSEDEIRSIVDTDWLKVAEERLEIIKQLKRSEQALKKKVAFLQKFDTSVLTDETGPGTGHADVTFLMENVKVIKAHRFILASKSSIFEKMFATDTKESFSGEIHVDDVSGPVLRGLIEFLYTAEVKFTDEVTAGALLMVAKKYKIPELQEMCETEFLSVVAKAITSLRTPRGRILASSAGFF